MSCELFETRLNQLLDLREVPAADEQLASHAEHCECCRELLAMQELLFDGLDLLERPTPPAGFARRTVSTLAVSPRRPAYFAPRWLALAAPLAAALLLALILGPRLSPRSEPRVAAPQRKGVEQRGAPGAAALVNAGRGKRSAEKQVEREPQPLPGAFAQEEYRQFLEQFPQRFPEVQRDALEKVERIPGGLRPISTSFGVAVGLIRNTLPRGKDEPAPPKPQAAYPLVANFAAVA